MGAMALVLGLSSNFVELAIGSAVVRMLAFSVCILALPAVRKQATEEQRDRAYRLPGGYTIPIIGLGVCLFLISHSTVDDWLRMSIPLIIGIGLYSLEKWFSSRREKATGGSS